MRDVHGRDLSPFDESFIAATLAKCAEAAAQAAPEDYAALLARDPAEARAFFTALSVGYSRFFRDPLTFSLLEQVILPTLLHEHQRRGAGEIRVWSAGCASGEEAYSITMLLDRLLETLESPPTYRVFATDVNESRLTAARRAVYDSALLGNVTLGYLERYFDRRGRSYVVKPELQSRVDFSAYDLLDPTSTCVPASIFGDFDLVFCSNVLIYYSAVTRRTILDRIRRCLCSGGRLVTSDVERSIVRRAGGFSEIVPPVPVYRKNG